MKKRLVLNTFLLSFFLFFQITIQSQSVDEIKSQPKMYIWGQGSGITLNEADNYALRFLIGQISTHVESKFRQRTEWGAGKEFDEKVEMVINTYSSATLQQTERIVIQNEPDALVFRYIKREDIAKVFEKRKKKALEFVWSAQKSKEYLQIADALKYYYWAFNLLKSHPDFDEIYYTDEKGKKHLLSVWIPVQMNNIFSKIKFSVKKLKNQENELDIVLSIKYNSKPVTNLDYSYWTGRDWSNIISAKDGIGFMEFYGASAKNIESIKLKIEYLFTGEALIDKELESVMTQIKPVPFRQSYFKLEINQTETNQVIKKEEKNVAGFNKINNPLEYKHILDNVVKAIRTKQYSGVEKYFTADAYSSFISLVQYGNARILIEPDWKAAKLNNSVIFKAVKMSFSFKNNKKFVEDVVFSFNEKKQIESVSFALSQKAEKSIMEKDVWSEQNRLQIISFMEDYKTAYALKKLEYIESIFADDALIIVGRYVLVKNPENRFINNKVVQYNRYSKATYIKRLGRSFKSNEFINLKFEESSIRKGAKGNIYGIQIKQSYFSTNYGDVGYLFLMVDLNKPEMPVIHIRTWQPEKDGNGEIYGLKDF